ncbi:MAG: polysaccharide deacetylase family protein, partial [Chloroflexota bacterium]
MRKYHVFVGTLLAAWILFSFLPANVLFTSSSSAEAMSYTFNEGFDGSPAAPQPWADSAVWDISVHSRDASSWYALPAMQADFGSDCSDVPNSHQITAYEDVVYQCNGQVVTAINGSGYGSAIIMPNHMVDFSSGEAVIRFDTSTLRTSTLDFFDIWITPFDKQLHSPTISWMPDLFGAPRDAVHINLEPGSYNRFAAKITRDFQTTGLPTTGAAWQGYEYFLTPTNSELDTFELRISETHIKFGMPEHDFWWIDTTFAALGWNQGVVQFGHQSANPTSPCGNNGSCGPNSWHWDNISIDPAQPFTMIHADRRYIDASSPDAVTFSSAVPADAYLRFAAIGQNIEVSFDDGATWAPAQLQEQANYNTARFQTYWIPLAQGTTSVKVQGQNWWGGGWHARNFTVFSELTGPLPTLTPTVPVTPTDEPTNTPTPAPTNTPTTVPTATPVVIPTRDNSGDTLTYILDRTAVPDIAFDAITLNVYVGAIAEAQVFTDQNVYVPHAYDAATGILSFTTTADSVDVILLGAADFAAAGAVTLADLKDNKAWAWSIGLDDNTLIKNSIDVIEAKGWTGTLYMIGNIIDDTRQQDWIVDKPDLLTYLANGWSVGNHTWSHECYGGFDYSQTVLDGYDRLTEIVAESSRPDYLVTGFAA